MGDVKIRAGLQLAGNLALEFESEGDPPTVSADILQCISAVSHGLEANLQRTPEENTDPPRRGLIIPEVVPTKPIREKDA